MSYIIYAPTLKNDPRLAPLHKSAEFHIVSVSENSLKTESRKFVIITGLRSWMVLFRKEHFPISVISLLFLNFHSQSTLLR